MAIDRDRVNEIIGVKESYQLPPKLLKMVMDPTERVELFEKFLAFDEPMDRDWFTDYFQQEQSDRKALKQDYTPECLTELVSRLREPGARVIGDLCAGTGGLTIKEWTEEPGALFYCEEISGRAVPLLLFNLAIRNMNAIIMHGDTLTREAETVYRLTPGERFSDIETIDEVPPLEFDRVVSNPPYSLKWDPSPLADDMRFSGIPMPPKSKADYAFILTGLHMLKDGGEMIVILPHGVLFRGRSEGKIRQHLLELRAFDYVIGVPDNMFMNTGIPVAVIRFVKGAKITGDDDEVYFIDASKNFEKVRKVRKVNVMTEDHIARILSAVRFREVIEYFADYCMMSDIREEDYNLNIPRYVDAIQPEPTPDFVELAWDLYDIEIEIRRLGREIAAMTEELAWTDESYKPEGFDEAQARWIDAITARDIYGDYKRPDGKSFDDVMGRKYSAKNDDEETDTEADEDPDELEDEPPEIAEGDQMTLEDL